MINFEEALVVAGSLAAALGRPEWLHGVGVETDEAGFFVTVRVDPAVPLDVARLDGAVPDTLDGVRVVLKHEDLADLQEVRPEGPPRTY